MATITFTSTGDLDINPSVTSSKNDFDFLVGKWIIHNKKLRSRLNNCTEWIEFDAVQEMRKVLSGIGNVDNLQANIDGNIYEGMAVRLFDPAKKLWSIYWADNNLGILEKPVVGSFDKNTGDFFCKEKYNDIDIIMQFHWDISNPEKPLWSQAFSADNGKSWEWNWYMYMEKVEKSEEVERINKVGDVYKEQDIQVLELRNYVIKPGQLDRFIDYYETNLIHPQNELNSFTLGQYKIKGAENNFFFIRAFHNMVSRNKFLNNFYLGEVWKKHSNAVNPMIVNNDNVHLLKPLTILHAGDATTFNSNWFGKQKGIAVVDYYTANQKLDKLINIFKTTHLSILKAAGIENISFWVSETTTNEFIALPVFQDKDLLVSIAFYKDELEYQTKIKMIDENMSEAQKTEMMDTVTIQNTLIIYPTPGSFLVE